jgi:hypothetical protein
MVDFKLLIRLKRCRLVHISSSCSIFLCIRAIQEPKCSLCHITTGSISSYGCSLLG